MRGIHDTDEIDIHAFEVRWRRLFCIEALREFESELHSQQLLYQKRSKKQ
jgi:hypothetical protein